MSTHFPPERAQNFPRPIYDHNLGSALPGKSRFEDREVYKTSAYHRTHARTMVATVESPRCLPANVPQGKRWSPLKNMLKSKESPRGSPAPAVVKSCDEAPRCDNGHTMLHETTGSRNKPFCSLCSAKLAAKKMFYRCECTTACEACSAELSKRKVELSRMMSESEDAGTPSSLTPRSASRCSDARQAKKMSPREEAMAKAAAGREQAKAKAAAVRAQYSPAPMYRRSPSHATPPATPVTPTVVETAEAVEMVEVLAPKHAAEAHHHSDSDSDHVCSDHATVCRMHAAHVLLPFAPVPNVAE